MYDLLSIMHARSRYSYRTERYSRCVPCRGCRWEDAARTPAVRSLRARAETLWHALSARTYGSKVRDPRRGKHAAWQGLGWRNLTAGRRQGHNLQMMT